MASDDFAVIYRSDTPLPSLPLQSIFEYLLDDVDFSDSTRSFVECQGGREVTLGQLKLQAQQLGVGLLESLRLSPGDIVMLNAPNSIDWIITLLATQFAGLRTSLANPAYIAQEFEHVVSLTQPSYFFTTSDQLAKLDSAGVKQDQILLLDADKLKGDIGARRDYRSLFADEGRARSAKSFKPKSYEETAYIPCSSGTTGLPKGCEVTHRNVVCMLTSIMTVESGLYRRAFRSIGLLPFYHAYALVMGVHLTIKARGTLFILGPFNPQTFIDVVHKEQIDYASLVPPVLVVLAKHPAATKEKLGSLEIVGCGAAPLDADIEAGFAKKIDVDVLTGWGMSETTVAGLGLRRCQTVGTVGPLLPGIEARLVDPESGKDVKRGERGELWMRSKNVFKGYYRNQKATEETITRDGWLKTGDVATVNDKDEFSIVDRLKSLIKYKGHQVAPAELEGVLLAHPKVAVAAVIGVYDKDQATELPRAYVQLAEGTKDTEASIEKELREFVAKRVSHIKHLRGGVRVLDVVPVSPSGKLLRKELQALVKKKLERDEQAPKAKL